MQDNPFIRQIRCPISEEQLRPLAPQCRVVQFDAPLTDADFAKLLGFMERYPHVPLRIYGHYGVSTDLAFLKWFPGIRGFQVDVYDLEDLEGLSHLPDSLEFLSIGQTKRRLSLKPIGRFSKLRDLALEGHDKDIDVIARFSNLVYLTLRSITLPDLGLLQELGSLRSFALKLGGTRDLSFLPGLRNLRYLELWMVRGLADVEPVRELANLRFLFLQDLKHVASLPSLGPLAALRRCQIENLKSLSDLSPISHAPNLEELVVINMRQLGVEHFAPFKGHKQLKAVTIGLGSVKRNTAASLFLGLPKVANMKPIQAYVEDS